MRPARIALAVTFAACALSVSPALAQPYPSKPVRLVVPFAAGGAVDQLARIVAARLQESFGQPVVVENRAGAGGTTGANDVAKAAPDGYTILQNTNGQAISPAIYKSLPFDTMRDFIPVTQLVGTSTVLVANTKLPARSARELIALAKAKPGSLNYGMTGVGNSLHLTMEMFKRAAGIDIQAIPYRGDAPLNTALIAGEIDVAVGAARRDRAPCSIGRDTRAGGEQRAALAAAAGRADVLRRCRPRLRGFGLAGLVRAGEDAARDRRRDPSRDREDHRRSRDGEAPARDGQRPGRLDARSVRGKIPRRRREIC